MSRVIQIEELTRVEGHGRIEVTFKNNTVKDAKVAIFEGTRFFEAFLEGVKYDKVPDITRRICGICTASHSLASIRAIEKAFKVKVTRQTQLLRDLLIHGEIIESNALHVFMLALPDYLGFSDAMQMASKYPGEVKAALQLKKAGNMVHNVLSGREVHGMNERVGGFSKVPDGEGLLEVRRAMKEAKVAAKLAVELFAKVDVPRYAESDNILMALDPGEKYGFTGEHTLISDGKRYPVERYLELTNERPVKYSSAKKSTYNGSPFMVGALSRVLINKTKLRGTAKQLYNKHQSHLTGRNSLTNNLAQSIELVHSVDRCMEDIDKLLKGGLKDEALVGVDVKKSRGIGAVEAPRGTLYHDYTFNADGCIVKANIITPTAQNTANMEKDLRVAAEKLVKKTEGEHVHAFELIARAYDPCISCSVH
jgi:sulfhydrogenase subunit alpha